MTSSACFHIYTVNKQGEGHRHAPEDIPLKISKDFTWMHFNALHDDVVAEMDKCYGEKIDPHVSMALLASETRPRLEQLDKGFILILRGANLHDPDAPEDMISIRLWVVGDCVVSTSRRPLKTITDIEDRIKAGKGPKTTGAFLTLLCRRLFDRFEPILADLDDLMDIAEEEVLDEPDYRLRSSIVKIRKQTIFFRRYFAPQRDVINRLCTLEHEGFTTADRKQFQVHYDRITRYVEDMDMIRDRSQVVQDELTNVLAERMNKNMYMVSIVAAIFLPLGFLTGLMGINIPVIPWVDAPHAFEIFCGFLIFVVIVQIVVFRRLKWI